MAAKSLVGDCVTVLGTHKIARIAGYAVDEKARPFQATGSHLRTV